MSDDWHKVYDLADDTETVELVQRATLNTTDFGLEPDVALYGSEEWWSAIDDGRIPLQESSGTITRVFATGGWPEFAIDEGGASSRWTRVGEPERYAVGMQARVEFVVQRARKKGLEHPEQNEVIRIWLRRAPNGD